MTGIIMKEETGVRKKAPPRERWGSRFKAYFSSLNAR